MKYCPPSLVYCVLDLDKSAAFHFAAPLFWAVFTAWHITSSSLLSMFNHHSLAPCNLYIVTAVYFYLSSFFSCMSCKLVAHSGQHTKLLENFNNFKWLMHRACSSSQIVELFFWLIRSEIVFPMLSNFYKCCLANSESFYNPFTVAYCPIRGQIEGGLQRWSLFQRVLSVQH